MNVYVDLTREFNAGRLRAVICSGQAVVLHRLAIMSKDGDWILREDAQALEHVLDVLARHGARYRFGAPLDARWMAGAWSAHLEFRSPELRVRTDFFTRPPRIAATDLARMWREQEGRDPPFVDAALLAELKKTNREKDFAVIGELARIMTDPRQQLLYSRSALDLLELARAHPHLVEELTPRRALLAELGIKREAIEEALDRERRALMHANERRLQAYRVASQRWADAWQELERETARLPLPAAHAILAARAQDLLPTRVDEPR
ncbi:MAG: hypothetical protein HOP15_13415 [Planctomycetes bacterium]|nr:hypothetical protein [Planctomycetota bacterium]